MERIGLEAFVLGAEALGRRLDARDVRGRELRRVGRRLGANLFRRGITRLAKRLLPQLGSK